MFAEEGVFGVSIMIERDPFPPLRVVTCLALHSEVGSMDIAFLMTGVTVGRRLVLIQPSLVATLAGRYAMLAEEGVFGVSIMIE